MFKELDVRGRGLEAKGRNGYFRLARVEVLPMGEGRIDIALFSSSPLAHAPPVRLTGTKKQIVDLLFQIIKAIKEDRHDRKPA